MTLNDWQLLPLGIGLSFIIYGLFVLVVMIGYFIHQSFKVGKRPKNKWREKMIKRIEKERRDFR